MINTLSRIETLRFDNIKSYNDIEPRIVKEITQCVASAFGGCVSETDALEHINGDVIFVKHDPETNRTDAFCSLVFDTPNRLFKLSNLSDELGCYFAAATVAKCSQGSGLYKDMNTNRTQVAIERNAALIFTRTQNPRVQAGIQSVLEEISEKGIINGFSLERRLIKGCYGQMLTNEIPFSRRVDFSELNYNNGDAYALLFHLKK